MNEHSPDLAKTEVALAQANPAAAGERRDTPPQAAARAFWQRQSVRAQLLSIFLLIDVIVMLAAGTVTVLRARDQVRVEVAASMRLAELFVGEAITLVQRDPAPNVPLTELLKQLRFLRHVRISVNVGSEPALPVVADERSNTTSAERSNVPAWFARLAAPPIETKELPIIVRGRKAGSVIVAGEPSDEIAEIWGNTLALGTVAGIVDLAVIALLYVILGRVLAPLTGLARGLAELEHRNYQVRLPVPSQSELAAIASRFNSLAQTLEATRSENTRLSTQLINSQDDERRRTALELHDEVGPCLFGLKAQATSIGALLDNCPDAVKAGARGRVSDILEIIARLQAINRDVLNRLRPMALGHVPLKELLADLVQDRARHCPAIAFDFSCGSLARSYGDSIDLTIYRCLQESLTNAIRHGNPQRIEVLLNLVGDRADKPCANWTSAIELKVRDNGRGMAPQSPAGYGINGMRDRVVALGGRFSIDKDSETGHGTCVYIALPLRDVSTISDESAGGAVS
jgi:two-component system sensor histidine kinase UhpB